MLKDVSKTLASIGMVALASLACETTYFGETTDVDSFFNSPWPSDVRLLGPQRMLGSGTNVPAWYNGIKPFIPDVDNLTEADLKRFIVSNSVYFQGREALEDDRFGTNSAVYFKFDHSIAQSELISDPNTALSDDSHYMLAKLPSGNFQPGDYSGVENDGRLPLHMAFKDESVANDPYIAENSLAILPYPGYAMDGDSLYAAIVFKGLKTDDTGAGLPNDEIQRPELMQQVMLPYDHPDYDGFFPVRQRMLTQQQWDLWQVHKAAVEQYLAATTSKTIDDVLYFTVFSTQDVTAPFIGLRDALQTLEYSDFSTMIQSLAATGSCTDPTDDTELTELKGTIRMPRWQANDTHIADFVTLPERGDTSFGHFPFTLGGGQLDLRFDAQGKLRYFSDDDRSQLIEFAIAVPCNADPAAYVVGQAGSTSQASAGAAMMSSYLGSNKYEVLAIGVGDYMSARWAHPASQEGFYPEASPVNHGLTYPVLSLPDDTDYQLWHDTYPEDRWTLFHNRHYNALNAMLGSSSTGTLPFVLDDFGFRVIVRTNALNPLAARTNVLQAAAESFILKRILQNLPAIVADKGVDLSAVGIAPSRIAINASTKSGIVGFSQGAHTGVFNMLMDPEGYDFAYWGNGSGGVSAAFHSDETNNDISTLMRYFLDGIEEENLDEFHPIVSFMQTLMEGLDPVNYIHMIHNHPDLLVTGGHNDSLAAPYGSRALATALARYNLIRSTGEDPANRLLALEGVEQVVGLAPTPYPLSAPNINVGTSGESLGIYSYFLGGHWGWSSTCVIGEFMKQVMYSDGYLDIDPCILTDSNPPPITL